MKRFLSFLVVAAFVLSAGAAYARNVYVVELVRANGTVSSHDEYNSNSQAQARANYLQTQIDNGACDGCHVETGVYDNGQKPIGKDQE